MILAAIAQAEDELKEKRAEKQKLLNEKGYCPEYATLLQAVINVEDRLFRLNTELKHMKAEYPSYFKDAAHE